MSPVIFFEIRVQNPAFWALLALFYYGGRGRAKKWSSQSRSGCYAPVLALGLCHSGHWEIPLKWGKGGGEAEASEGQGPLHFTAPPDS